MNFSLTTFVVEINAIPMIVFQAKWQAEADQISREWLNSRRDEFATKGPGGVDLAPVFKLRLAKQSERATYESESGNVEFVGDVKLVTLIHATPPNLEEPQPHSVDDFAAEQIDTNADDGDEC